MLAGSEMGIKGSDERGCPTSWPPWQYRTARPPYASHQFQFFVGNSTCPSCVNPNWPLLESAGLSVSGKLLPDACITNWYNLKCYVVLQCLAVFAALTAQCLVGMGYRLLSAAELASPCKVSGGLEQHIPERPIEIECPLSRWYPCFLARATSSWSFPLDGTVVYAAVTLRVPHIPLRATLLPQNSLCTLLQCHCLQSLWDLPFKILWSRTLTSTPTDSSFPSGTTNSASQTQSPGFTFVLNNQ